MRYWLYLIAKLAGAGGLLWITGVGLLSLLPQTEVIRGIDVDPFGHNLGYTVLAMFYGVVSILLLWGIIVDHRYLCRTCMRRLRMPLATGSWKHVLLSRPRTEYICPYGHGTLKVEDLQITGRSGPEWQANEDMWKELAKK
jgi:hypothetical protein